MATEKLSQFTDGGVPALTDYVAGANAGSPNLRYTMANILQRISGPGSLVASGQITLYVSTTGSDSNPGTLANPFATVQHAVFIASQYNYAPNTANLVIWVVDGTYSIFFPTKLPELVGYPIADFGAPFIGSLSGVPANCIFQDVNGNGLWSGTGKLSDWKIANFTHDTSAIVFQGYAGATGNINGAIFTDTLNTGGLFVAFLLDDSFFQGQGGWTFSSALTNGISGIVSMEGFCFTLINTTIALPVGGLNFHGGDSAADSCQLSYKGTTFTGGAGSNGGVALARNCQLVTSNAMFSDLPYTGAFTGDITCSITDGVHKGGFFLGQFSGLPTTSALPAGTWQAFKDISGGGVYVATNDGGVIKKVQLV